MGKNYSDRGLNLDGFERIENNNIEIPCEKEQDILGIEDVDKFIVFEDAATINPDKFKKIYKFGYYNKKILREILSSDKPLTSLQKKAISNLAYEYDFFRAYHATVRESVRLFGDSPLKGRTLREILGSSFLSLRGYLSMWCKMGEVMRGDFSMDEKNSNKKDKKGADKISMRDFNSFIRMNGNDISGAIKDYYHLVDYDQEIFGRESGDYTRYSVSPQSKREALNLIKEKYECFTSEQSVKDCLRKVGVKGLPSLGSS